ACSAGTLTKSFRPNAWRSDSTKRVPMPARNVPVRTVTFSVVGCVCGGILYPLGKRNRIVNGSDLLGSPCITTISAPGGKTGGAGLQLRLCSGPFALAAAVDGTLIGSALGESFEHAARSAALM